MSPPVNTNNYAILAFISNSIRNYENTHGYSPTTIHLTPTMLLDIIEELDPHHTVTPPIKLFGIPVETSDTFALSATEHYPNNA